MAEQHSQTEEYENPYKFNGKELDQETGLYYYGARYYDPRVSIWMGVDPLMESFPNANPYNYCLQNPVNLVDPNGMECFKNEDIIFKGTDKKEIRVKAPGEDIYVPVPFVLGKTGL